MAGKYRSRSRSDGSVESLVAASRPSLNSRMASVHALFGPYIKLPSKNGVTSFSCRHKITQYQCQYLFSARIFVVRRSQRRDQRTDVTCPCDGASETSRDEISGSVRVVLAYVMWQLVPNSFSGHRKATKSDSSISTRHR